MNEKMTGQERPGGSPVPRRPPGKAVPQDGPRLIIHQGANLPHWRMEGATYAVTFRLADSLPQEVLLNWKAERKEIVRRAEEMGRPLTQFEQRKLEKLHSERVEAWLDQGYGSCVLRDPRIARLVKDAMRYFDGQRYDLLAWCVMPNHVHAVLLPYPGHELSMILLSWKGFTGKRTHEILNTVGGGAIWQKESYDHLVRDEQDLIHNIEYVLANAEMAGIRDWPWVGCAKWNHPSGR